MDKIKRLSPLLADMIAAGEVVERPASVVKELIENSIDAGATQITVEIRNGGMSYIRVTDDGCGMSEEDAKTAFLRHATSKLRTERDLEAIGTLGFRGEALAAISAVSKAELMTKERGSDFGTRVFASGGGIQSSEPCGCPDGTTFIIHDLFFNTPARLKFIKNDRSEALAVSSAVTRAALSHPEVAIKFIKDGEDECHTPGDGQLSSCVYAVLGREFAKDMLSAEFSDGKISVSGLTSSPSAVRGNRTRQYFFVNGRPVVSKTLQAALERGYGNALFTGRFPACVLHIELSPASVDVNVHPTKTEVKFSDANAVFSAVYSAVQFALENEHRLESNISESTEKAVISNASDAKRDYSEHSSAPAQKSAPHTPYSSGTYKAPNIGASTVYRAMIENRDTPLFVRDSVSPRGAYSYRQSRTDTDQTELIMPSFTPDVSDQSEAVTGDDFTIIGECLNTYILAEQGDSLILIDKHAAHERVIFDKLRSESGAAMVQLTLAPVICELARDDIALLCENSDTLAEMGFEIDQFSDRTVAVRQLPADVDTGDIQSLIDELCSDLANGDTLSLQQRRDDILHTVACKAAIKAGKKSEKGELYGLVKAVLREEVRYCPHGRPVCISMSKRELDSKFNRV